jgi:hypothetical protein
MKAINEGNGSFRKFALTLARALPVAGFLFGAISAVAQLPPGFKGGPTNAPLDSWSFYDDHTNWTSDLGYAPVSFTNLNFSYLGDGASLVVDTNIPAWLQYNVYENDGTTNLTVEVGSVTFWFAPDWSSTNDANGGLGPQEYGRLFEVGGYTPDSSYGWWSLYVDEAGANLYFSAQTNDGSGNTYTLSAPIDWTTNYFHFVALTYSSTNVSLYLDGQLATNDPGGLSIWPGNDVLSNGFYIGSDSNGIYQAEGLFNTVATYNYPLDSNDVQEIYDSEHTIYMINPYNIPYMDALQSAQTTNTTFTPYSDVITGPGNLQRIGSASSCVNGTNAWNVWITNVVATMVGSGTNATINLEFTIEGGSNGVPFDVFVNSVLSFGTNGVPWAWEGQGYQCNTYLLTNMPNTTCFLILGTPQDSDHDGLTDAYELLVSKSNPTNYSTDGTGMADGWEVLYFGHTGIDPNGDPDGDGLSNYQEYQMYSAGYDPVNWNSITNSVVGDGYQDYSGDGLANLMEAAFGGNMLTNNPTWKANTSGDGFPDEYKTMVGLNTNSAAPVLGLPPYSKNPIP